MLLTCLAEHARHRKDLPPPFYQPRPVRWAIHLRPGGAAQLTGLGDGDPPKGVTMAVPSIYRSGVRPPAALLADDLRYVLGYTGDDPRTADADAARRHESYVALLTRWRDSAPGNPVAQAVVTFFAEGLHRDLIIPPGARPTDVAAIMIGDDERVHRRDSAVAFWGQVATERKASADTGICLVCGQPGALLDTIPEAVKAGAIPVGTGRGQAAQIVSVNKPAQGRGGKIQLASSPVCGPCGSSAMSVLNALLADKSSRYRTEDSVLAWWLKNPQPFPWMDYLDNPQPGTVGKFIAAIGKPTLPAGAGTASPNAFYAVTLSANQSRAVVRDWIDVPLGAVEASIGQWYADHQVTGLDQDGPYTAPLWLMARSTGRWGTEGGQDRYLQSFMPHGCQRDLLLTALRGTRPPGHLLPHLLQRIRADGRIDHSRAALLRLILVRSGTPKEISYMAGLDPDLPKPSYQCGRMFAVLEEIQYTALGSGINTTIADKYLSSASATPLPILTMLHKNANGHLRRIRRTKPGAYNALSSRLHDVFTRLDGESGLPRILDLDGQGEFLLGYHHQRAADIAAGRAGAARKRTATDDEGEDS